MWYLPVTVLSIPKTYYIEPLTNQFNGKKSMSKVDVGRSLQNKFQPLTFKGETYFEVTYPHRPCTCFFLAMKMIPQRLDVICFGYTQDGHW